MLLGLRRSLNKLPRDWRFPTRCRPLPPCLCVGDPSCIAKISWATKRNIQKRNTDARVEIRRNNGKMNTEMKSPGHTKFWRCWRVKLFFLAREFWFWWDGPSIPLRVSVLLVSRPMAATHRKLTPCWKESPHQRNVATDAAGATGAMSSRYQKCSPRFVQECYQVCMCHKGCKNINVFIQLCRS